MIVCLPDEDGMAPDLLSPHVPIGAGDHRLATAPRGRRYVHRTVRAVDPFGEPMEGVRAIAVVRDNLIAIRDARSGAPTQFQGHAFVQVPGGPAQAYDGSFTSVGGNDGSLGLSVAPLTLHAVSDAEGLLDLTGAIDGLYEFALTSPVGGEPVPAEPFARSEGVVQRAGKWVPTYSVDAPVGGVQIERPDGIPREGSDWRQAKIELICAGVEITASVDESGRARALVPPFVPIDVRVASAGNTFTARVHPLSPGQRAIAVPERVRAKPPAPLGSDRK